MKTSTVKSVKEGYDKMITYILEDGTKWISHKLEYKVGDLVSVTPFMGAVKVALVKAV